MRVWVGLTSSEPAVLAIAIAASAVSACGLPSLLVTTPRVCGSRVLHTPSYQSGGGVSKFGLAIAT